jgi:hypothetical protein
MLQPFIILKGEYNLVGDALSRLDCKWSDADDDYWKEHEELCNSWKKVSLSEQVRRNVYSAMTTVLTHSNTNFLLSPDTEICTNNTS